MKDNLKTGITALILTIITFMLMIGLQTCGEKTRILGTTTGDCNSTCYLTTGNYNITLTEGVITDFYYPEIDDYNWARDDSGSNGSNIGDVYCGGWKMSAGITSTNCIVSEGTDTTTINCNNTNSTNNWTFHETYIELDTTCTAAYRIYYYMNDSMNTSKIWNGTTARTEAGWLTWSSATGIAGMTHTDNDTTTDAILLFDWDESEKTSFDFTANSSTAEYDAIAIGRSSQITAGNVMKQYIKVLLPNESASTKEQGYLDVMEAFRLDHTYGDPIPSTSECDVYVNMTHLSCSDGYTRSQATNPSTPWCTLAAPLTNDKALSGDQVCLTEGEYHSYSDITSWTLTSNITIKSYPGDDVNITGYTSAMGIHVEDNGLWTNKSGGLWEANISGGADTSYPMVYLANNSMFFTVDTSTALTTCPYTRCAYLNMTPSPDKLMLKFNDTTTNPNNISIYTAYKYQPIYVYNLRTSDDVYLKFQNLTFKYLKWGIRIRNSSNVIVENCDFYGGMNSIYIDGDDAVGLEGIIIRNNYFDGLVETAWSTDWIKAATTMESDSIRGLDFPGRVEIYLNTFNHSSGGVSLYAGSQTEFNNSEIYNNTAQYASGSFFEIEDYCSASKWYNNRITNCTYAGVSFAPAHATSTYPCNFSYNIIDCNGVHLETYPSDYDDGWAIKAQARAGTNISNWIIDHNTFSGKGRALNTMDNLTGSTPYSAWENTNWTNNIFYANTEYILYHTSLATRGVFYDYNIYYEDGAAIFATRWNNDSLVTRTTLAAALASTDWDGTWDINSAQFNPQINPVSYVPENYSACTMSSTGSYVGAIPCTPPSLTYYVDIMSVSCSDTYDRITAQNPATPMCTFRRGITNISDGDTMIVVGGEYNESDDAEEYNDTGAYSLTNKRFTNLTKIISYPGDDPELSSRIADFYTTGGSNWKNQSSTVPGLWNFSYVTGSSYLSVMRVSNNAVYFIYTTYADVIDTTLPEGCYYNTAAGTDKLWCRFDNTSFNPNNEYWYVTRAPVLSLTNVTNLMIANLTFRGGLKGIYISTTGTSNNITITGNNFIGQTGTGGSVGTGIIDVRGAGNISILNNYVEQKRSEPWDWDTTKGSPMEVTAIRFEDCFSGINISNNKIESIFNGIMIYSTTTGKAIGAEIGYNNISDVIDDAIELEEYGDDILVHHNMINNSFVGISIIPFNCTNTCRIEYNVIQANASMLSTPTTSHTGECFKLAGGGNPKLVNVNLTHNTCIGRGIYAAAQLNSQHDTNWIDNIFYSNLASNNRVIDTSGLATDGAFYNHNLYWKVADDNLFRYWNNDTRTTEYNLSQALASSSWDGTWDINSLEANPSFLSDGYTPINTSEACTMSSTGSYVGAIPCGETDELLVLIVNIMNSSFTTNDPTPTVYMNFTGSVSSTASCGLYFNNTIKDSNASVLNNTATGLTPSIGLINGRYEVYFNCTDTGGNTNKSNVINLTITDSTPPAPIINFASPSQGYDWIYATWNNPADADFNHTEMYMDGSFIANTSNEYYNFTGLTNSTNYQFTAITVDSSGNKGNNATLEQSTLTPLTPGNLTATQNINPIYYPVSISLATFENWTWFNTNFTRFLQSRFNQSNISAYGQTSNNPCYTLTNNGNLTITIRVKESIHNSSFLQRVSNGSSISSSPSLVLTGSDQDLLNLSGGASVNISCWGSYNNSVVNNTYNTSIVWNSTVI